MRINPQEILAAKRDHPAAKVVGHPESPPDILALCDAVRSTSGMVKYAREDPAPEFIVATECGMVHRLERDVPGKVFHGLSSISCPNMKKTTLEKVVKALREMQHRIEIPEEIADRARRAVERMVAIG